MRRLARAARRFLESLDGNVPVVDQRKGRATGRQRRRDGRADAAGSAGDDGKLALELAGAHIELAVPILIWFRETRHSCLLVLLLFHLGNEWTMNLFLFHWVMLCGWLAFLTADDLNFRGLGRSHAKAEK